MTRPYVLQHTVLFEETNLVGNVYFVNYLRWQGHCRERFLIENAPTVLAALQNGSLALVTVSVQADFYGECFAGDEVVIAMTQGKPGSSNRVQMNFSYEVRGQPIAVGRQTVASMQRSATGGALVASPIPDELRRALELFPS